MIQLHHIKYDWICDTFVSIFKFIWIYNKLIKKYKKLIKCSKKKFAFIYHQINYESITYYKFAKKKETNDEFNSILKFQMKYINENENI